MGKEGEVGGGGGGGGMGGEERGREREREREREVTDLVLLTCLFTSLPPSPPHLYEGGGLQLAELPHASGDLIVRHSGQHFCRSLQEAHDGIVGHTELVCGLDDLGMGESEIGNMGM